LTADTQSRDVDLEAAPDRTEVAFAIACVERLRSAIRDRGDQAHSKGWDVRRDASGLFFLQKNLSGAWALVRPRIEVVSVA
jgi:hypothetical protein